MIPHDTDVGIFYGVRAIGALPLGARVSRRRQSEDARRLLADLSARAPVPVADGAEHRSISHSRGVVAAAIAHGARIGVDVEYMCPRRNGDAILQFLFGTMPGPVPRGAFYRAWTFGEAYFKAFGFLPEAEGLLRVIEHDGDESWYRLDVSEGATVGVHHSEPFDDFALAIVWEMAEAANARDRTLRKRSTETLVGAGGLDPTTR